MSEQKTFVNAAFFDEKVFDDGGSIIKVDITDTKEFIKFINDNSKENKLKLVISKKRTPVEGKSSHYGYVDTFISKPKTNAPAAKPVAAKATKKAPAPVQEQDEELI